MDQMMEFWIAPIQAKPQVQVVRQPRPGEHGVMIWAGIIMDFVC